MESVRLAAGFGAGALGGALAMLPVALVAQGLVSPFPAVVRVAVWFIAGATALAANLRGDGCALPQRHRQIDQGVISGRDPASAVRFGAQLGTGVMTYAPSCAPHALAVSLVLLLPSVLATAAALTGFAIGRSAGLLGRALVADRAAFERWFQRVVAVLQRGLAVAVVLLLASLAVGHG